MEIFFRHTNRLFGLTAILLVLLVIGQPASAAEQKVAIVPFAVNAEKDLSFLQRGISNMLSSRLARPGKVAVVDAAAVAREAGEAQLTDATARELGRRLGADYVLFGSLTVLGGSVSIDSRMVKVASDQPAMTFFSQADGMEKVIPKIDRLAADINRRVFAAGPAAPAAKAPAGPTATAQSQEGLTMGTHPEKLLQQQGFGGSAEQGVATPFIMTGGTGATYRGFWKSPNYKVLFNGLALGDVDNDGLIETVVITPDEVICYRGQDRKFFKAHQLPKADDNVFIGVDVADINDNGTPEIFVTSLNRQRNVLTSLVYEWDGRNFKAIVTGAHWYFRVAELPDRGPVLYGQKRGRDGVFGGAIYEMVWQHGEYVPQTRLQLSGTINLMGFAAGDVRNDGRTTYLAYDDTDHIQVLNGAGKRLSISGEVYGGSTLYYLRRIDDPGQVQNIQYFPMRLLVADITGDGTNEVVVAKNHEMAKRKLQTFRVFTKTQLHSLVWDGLGLASNWRTRATSGFIRDFAVGDFDNDGAKELVAAVVISEGATAITKPKCTIIAYELKPAEKKTKDNTKPQ